MAFETKFKNFGDSKVWYSIGKPYPGVKKPYETMQEASETENKPVQF